MNAKRIVTITVLALYLAIPWGSAPKKWWDTTPAEAGDAQDSQLVTDILREFTDSFDDITKNTKLKHIAPELENWQDDPADTAKWDIFISDLAYTFDLGFFNNITPEQFVEQVFLAIYDSPDSTLLEWHDRCMDYALEVTDIVYNALKLPDPTDPPTEPAPVECSFCHGLDGYHLPECSTLDKPGETIIIEKPVPGKPYPVYVKVCKGCEREHGHSPNCPYGKPSPTEPTPAPTNPIPSDPLVSDDVVSDDVLYSDTGSSGCSSVSSAGLLALVTLGLFTKRKK